MIRTAKSPGRFAKFYEPEFIKKENLDMSTYVNFLIDVKTFFTLANVQKLNEWLEPKIKEYEERGNNVKVKDMVENGVGYRYNDSSNIASTLDSIIKDKNLSQFLYYLCTKNENLPNEHADKLSAADISEIRNIADYYNRGGLRTASKLTRWATRAIKNSRGLSGGKKTRTKLIKKIRKKLTKKQKKYIQRKSKKHKM